MVSDQATAKVVQSGDQRRGIAVAQPLGLQGGSCSCKDSMGTVTNSKL